MTRNGIYIHQITFLIWTSNVQEATANQHLKQTHQSITQTKPCTISHVRIYLNAHGHINQPINEHENTLVQTQLHINYIILEIEAIR